MLIVRSKMRLQPLTTVPDGLGPSTGGIPPLTGGGPAAIVNSQDAPADLTPNQGTSYSDMIKYSGKASKSGGEIPDMGAEPIRDMYTGKDEIKAVGANGIKEKVGLDAIPSKDLPGLNAKPAADVTNSEDPFEEAKKSAKQKQREKEEEESNK